MPRYDTFLSHATADKPAVEHLARKLRDEGLEPFLDKWHLIPGQPWQETLEDALDQSRTCAVFLGKALGPWQNEEMRSALETRVRDSGFRVIPVLLPGGQEPGREELPRFLRRLTWVDFRTGLDDEEAFRRLLAGIRGEAPGPGGGGEPHSLLNDAYRCMAPPREAFVQRREYLTVRDALLAGGIGRATTVGITTAIHGAGGFGKTALAMELCYDELVREQYPDGILWTTLGEEMDAAGRLARVRDLIRWWTDEDPPAFETVSAASAHLRAELNGQRVLLVVDDVWRPEDVTPFQGLAPRATLLCTTRDRRTLPPDAVPIHVDAMEIPEAVRLLSSGLPERPKDLRDLSARLGEWPLLLKIVNRQLRALMQQDGLSLEEALQEVREALDAAGLTAFDREDFESRGSAVARTVGASLRRLSPDEVGPFEKLAIFPEDRDIPLAILENLWGLSAFATKKICERLHGLSLLLAFHRAAGTIRLHDVIRSYLLRRSERHLPEWNRSFLESFRPANGRWADLPRSEPYLWPHLFHHLLGAGQRPEGRELLLDFDYLRAKLAATDVNGLLADYSFFAEDEELRLVRGAFRLSAHVLAERPEVMREQLQGRLSDRNEAGIQNLLAKSMNPDAAWLRPRSVYIARPGGALIRTLQHPGTPRFLIVLPDGRLMSVSDEGKFWSWDVESGEATLAFDAQAWVQSLVVLDRRRILFGLWDGIVRVLDVDSGEVNQELDGDGLRTFALAVLDSRRVVAGTSNGVLQLWDLETGNLLRVLEGHALYISAVAALDHRRVVTGCSDGVLVVWDVESGGSLQVFLGHSYRINAVAALEGDRVISCSSDGTIQIWNAANGQTLQILAEHSGSVTALAIPGSRHALSGSADWTLRVWDLESGQSLQILEGHSAEILTTAVLDEHRVVSGSSDGTLRIWDVASNPARKLEKHSSAIRALEVWDDRRILSCSSDGLLRVWDLESGWILWSLETGYWSDYHGPVILDGHRVSYSNMIWDLDTGQVHKDLNWDEIQEARDRHWRSADTELQWTHPTLRRLLDSVRGAATAVLDSCRIVSGSEDGTLRVWNVTDSRVECQFILDGPVTALAIPNGHTIVAGDALGHIHFFDFVEPGRRSP